MSWCTISSEVVTALSALLGVVLGAFLTHWYNRKRDRLELKRDVLRRVMGYRWQLTGRGTSDYAVFTALNEIAVVFAGEKNVENALTTFRGRVNQGFRAEHFPALLEAMAKSARIPHKRWSKDLLDTPLAPPH